MNIVQPYVLLFFCMKLFIVCELYFVQVYPQVYGSMEEIMSAEESSSVDWSTDWAQIYVWMLVFVSLILIIITNLISFGENNDTNIYVHFSGVFGGYKVLNQNCCC